MKKCSTCSKIRLTYAFFDSPSHFFFSKCLAENTIKVGAVLPLTGVASLAGKSVEHGLRYFVDRFNNSADNDRLKIELVVEDSQSLNSRAVNGFKKLTKVDGIGLIFTVFGGHGMALKDLAERERVILWSFVIHPEQTKNTEFVFRYNMSIDADVDNVSKFIESIGARKIAVLYSKDEIGTYYNRKIAEVVQILGSSIVSEGVLVTDSHFKSVIPKLISNSPDIIFLYLFGSNLGLAVKQIREAGYKGRIYLGPHVLIAPDVIEIAGDKVKGAYFTNIKSSDRCSSELLRTRNSKDEIGFLSCFAYTSLELIVQTMKDLGLNGLSLDNTKTLAQRIRSLKTFTGTLDSVYIKPSGDIEVPVEIGIIK
ncbi:MAG: ABC transporter substrate-binding protein [Thermoplasmatales archaeon]